MGSTDQVKIYNFLQENKGNLYTSRQIAKNTGVKNISRKLKMLRKTHRDVREIKVKSTSRGKMPWLYGIK